MTTPHRFPHPADVDTATARAVERLAHRLETLVNDHLGGYANCARIIGVNPNSPRMWALGKSFPNCESLVRLTYVTGASADWVLTGIGQPPVHTYNEETPDSDS